MDMIVFDYRPLLLSAPLLKQSSFYVDWFALTVVADILCEFLEVAIHLILYVREVYPSGIFQKRKKYNVPVQVRSIFSLSLCQAFFLSSVSFSQLID